MISSAAFLFEVPKRAMPHRCRNFKSAALAIFREIDCGAELLTVSAERPTGRCRMRHCGSHFVSIAERGLVGAGALGENDRATQAFQPEGRSWASNSK